MHILVIPSFLPPYGGYFCIEQASALQRAGHEVRMLHCQQLGVTIYPAHFFTAPAHRWHESIQSSFAPDRSIDAYLTNMRGIPRCIRLNMQRYVNIVGKMFDCYVSKHGQPDFIHTHCAQWAGVAARVINRRTGIPYIITEHMSSGTYEANYGKGWTHDVWAKDVISDAYHHAHCVIPVSHELINDVKPFFGNDYKWHVISNVINTDFFQYRNRPSLNNRKFRFCCLAVSNGPSFYMKGYDVLLKAFSHVDNAELHIAGRGTDSARMHKAVKNCGNDNVYLHGELNRHSVRELLYNSDALVLASRSEVQPLVLLEAAATGIPYITTDVVTSSLHLDRIATIVPTGNANALTKEMSRFVNLRHVIDGEKAHKAVCQIASPEVVGRMIEQIFLTANATLK